MLRNIWNYGPEGGICRYLVFAAPNQPRPCDHKNSSTGLQQLSKEKDFNLQPSPLIVVPENRFSLPGVALIFYLLTRSDFFACVFVSLNGGHDCGAAWICWLSCHGCDLKKEDASSPSLSGNGMPCPVLEHQDVVCWWKARQRPRQRPGEKLISFALRSPPPLVRVSQTGCPSFPNMVIFKIKECWGESTRASCKTSRSGILRDGPNINTNRINSHARGVSGIHFMLALHLGLRFFFLPPRDCPSWKMFAKEGSTALRPHLQIRSNEFIDSPWILTSSKQRLKSKWLFHVLGERGDCYQGPTWHFTLILFGGKSQDDAVIISRFSKDMLP